MKQRPEYETLWAEVKRRRLTSKDVSSMTTAQIEAMAGINTLAFPRGYPYAETLRCCVTADLQQSEDEAAAAGYLESLHLSVPYDVDRSDGKRRIILYPDGKPKEGVKS